MPSADRARFTSLGFISIRAAQTKVIVLLVIQIANYIA